MTRTVSQTKLKIGLATALCFWIAVNSVASKELTLDGLFPTDRVLDVQIILADKDWDTIRHQERNFFSVLHKSRKVAPIDHPYTYVNASVTIDGVVFSKVGLRKKGFIGSQSTTRPSLKIKLNHIHKKAGIEGLTNLTFNNNKQDKSLVSQFMSYALFNAAGSPAPRCAYARVTVNGTNLGIYSHVETVRNPLFKRAFGNDKGTLYEGTVVDFYPGWEGSFEHKRGKDTPARQKIKQLIKVLENDNENIESAIGELVDLDSFYTFWALEGLLGFWDGYSGNKNNFFIYLNPETDRFHFLPWGADSLFRKFSGLESDPDAPISVKTQGLIGHKLYQLKSGRERYARTIMEIIEKHWNEAELLAELDRIEAMVKPHMVQSQLVFSDKEERETFADELEATREFIRQRRAEITEEIANGMPKWTKVPGEPLVMNPAFMALIALNMISSRVKLAGGFNRVDGLRLGPRLGNIYQLPGGAVFGEVTYGFSNKRWNYKLGAEVEGSVLRRLNLDFKAQIHRTTTVRDKDVLPNDVEQLWLAFGYGGDLRDYYQRDGAEIALRWQPRGRRHKLNLTRLSEDHQSLAKSTNWSLFRRGTIKEENTAITPGHMGSIGVAYDFKSGNGLSGWHYSVRIEHADEAMGSDFDFTQFQAHLRVHQPISDKSSLAIRLKFGGSTKALPVQRQFIIGGPGTLHGYELYEFAGDRMALLNVEFRRFLIPDTVALFFVDTGQVWDDKASFDVGDLKADVGIGFGLINADVDWTLTVAQALEEDRKPQLTMRWARRF